MSREMKYSGIPWIGDIPTSWSIMPHKRVMHKVKEIQEHYSGENILSLTMRGVIVRDLDAGGKMPTTFDGYQKVYPNNLLQCLFDIDVTPRCVGLIKDEGLTSPAYSQFAMYSNGYAPYYDYLLRYMDDRKTLLHLSKNLRSSLTETDFGAVLTCVPPVAEQQKIASFLDRKCAEVDEMIALQEQIIEELKAYKQSVITEAVTKGLNPDAPMRDSGIEWIGQIPEHWEVKRGKYMFRILSGAPFESELFTNDSNYMPLIRIRDIMQEQTEAYYMGSYTQEYVITKGDILVGMDGDFNVATWKGCDALLNQRVCKLQHFKEDVLPRFIYYALPLLLKRKNDLTYATTVKHLSTFDILAFSFTMPTISEQQAIANYLDEKCADIDSLIQTKLSKIDSLKEYKKSIIYEYVTGKREVNE